MAERPIDKGWAWFIAGGAFVNAFFVVGGFKTAGIIFVQVLERFNTRDSLAAWMIGLMSFGLSLYSPLATALGERYTHRIVTMLGAFVMSLAFLLTAFAPDVYFVVIVLGILVGFGNGFMYTPSMIIVGQNFEKHRSLAMGIAAAGASCGQLMIPLLIRNLLDSYGFQGCMMIYSAIILHSVAASALFRPASFYTKNKTKKAPSSQKTDQNSATATNAMTTPSQSLNSLVFRSQIQDSLTSTPMNALDDDKPNRYVPMDESLLCADNQESVNRHSAHYSSTGSLCMIPLDDHDKEDEERILNSSPDSPKHRKPEGHDGNNDLSALKPEKKTKCCGLLVKAFKKMYDREVFRMNAFWFALFGTVLANAGYIDQFLFIPPYAKQLGIPKNMSAVILSVSGVADFIGRISGGFLNNLKVIKTNYFVSLTLLAAVVCISISLSFPGVPSLFTHGIALGLLGGMYIALFPIIIMEIVGLARFPAAFALTMCGCGLINLPLPTIFGKISELTGSYFYAFSVLNAMMLAGSLLFLVIQVIHKLDKRRSKKCCRDDDNNDADAKDDAEKQDLKEAAAADTEEKC